MGCLRLQRLRCMCIASSSRSCGSETKLMEPVTRHIWTSELGRVAGDESGCSRIVAPRFQDACIYIGGPQSLSCNHQFRLIVFILNFTPISGYCAHSCLPRLGQVRTCPQNGEQSTNLSELRVILVRAICEDLISLDLASCHIRWES